MYSKEQLKLISTTLCKMSANKRTKDKMIDALIEIHHFLGEIYNVPSMVIDTHMVRIMGLLGFTKTKDAKKIEFEMMDLFNKEHWVKLTHMIIDHGRVICIARRPKCNECALGELCPSSLV